MIIVKLMGGIGNQMFQYALGRHLSILNNTSLKLDVSGFAFDRKRSYSLSAFNILEDFATTKDICLMKHRSIIFRILEKLSYNRLARKHIKEKKLGFEKHILNLHEPIYLDGYWQSEKYFTSIEDIIRKDYTLRKQLSSSSENIGEQILNTNSVSMHIRRGDYFSSARCRRIHGVCNTNYYYSSINYIKQNVGNPFIYIFSDDPDWVKENIRIDIPHMLVSHQSNSIENDFEDIVLMSRCKHNILSNSSYSWWGAWLNTYSGKIVVSPDRWFAISNYREAKDIIPEGWVKMQV